MLLFCPTCSNALTVTKTLISDDEPQGANQLECRTCPYRYVLERRWFDRRLMKRKEVEDVMGGANAWDNVDKTDAQCPAENCDGGKAFFYQVQIRSADEPMTTFLKCTTCGKRWKEN
ncbi:MAG: hypothetical protein M4579_004003 [Chaenotheca gracillima]|nr:MAG: hypothetical protein M4579_004003 [Chaenotheca gracillima]